MTSRPPHLAYRLAAFVCAALLVVVGRVDARVLLTRDQALALAFGGGGPADVRIERSTVFLTERQIARARELAGAGVDIPSALVTSYVATRNGSPVGTAYFDTHVVRTLPETLLVVVAPDGTVGRVEVAVFAEPEDYLPKPRWFAQFTGRPLDGDLSTKRGIHAITGATLSSGAATDAVRRVLAIHRAIVETTTGSR